MKRYLVLFAFQLLVCVLNAQTYTFNMHEMDNTKYRIVVDLQHTEITATKSSKEVFSKSIEQYTIDRQQKRIGLSVDWDEVAVTEPYGSSFFIISRGKGIAVRLEDGTEYKLKCDNATSHAATYDQLAKTLFPPPSPPPPPPSNNEYRTFTVNGVSFHMVQVQGGTFTMGATSEQLEGLDDYSLRMFNIYSKPTHGVTLSSYMIGQTEVTQALWLAVMGSNRSWFTGDSRRPVENVSWDDCQEFLRKLNSLTGQCFRLLTEAEWEFAARGGIKSKGYKYSGSNTLDNVAWYDENAYDIGSNSPNDGTHPVATKQPNELGLYDMSGNVYEWCNDYLDDYKNNAQTNPQGPSSGFEHVHRGGCWGFDAMSCRVSYRENVIPYTIRYSNLSLGLRLAL